MKTTVALGIALMALGGVVQAASESHDMSHHQMAIQAAPGHEGIGVLKAVDTSKVQIAHEPISVLGWPAMTMWFDLRDPLPEGLKVGDAVRFELIQADKKRWVIVKIGRK